MGCGQTNDQAKPKAHPYLLVIHEKENSDLVPQILPSTNLNTLPAEKCFGAFLFGVTIGILGKGFFTTNDNF